MKQEIHSKISNKIYLGKYIGKCKSCNMPLYANSQFGTIKNIGTGDMTCVSCWSEKNAKNNLEESCPDSKNL